MSVGALLGATIGVLLVLAVIGIGLALIANGQVTRNRHLLLDQVAPARRTALALENALVNEETGVRGFALTNEPSFLEPYDSGLRAERRAYRELEGHEAVVGRPLRADVEAVRASADQWRAGYIAPTLIPAARAASRWSARRAALTPSLRRRPATLRPATAPRRR